MAIQLEDWIPSYPSQDDPKIQDLFTRKAEFEEMGAELREEPPKRGQLYKHQKLFVRMMRTFDRVLNIAETGSGKSCQFIGLAQWYRANKKEIRKVYVFERGPTTTADFKNQVVCKCTDGEYETPMVKRARGKARKGNITRELKKWYEITTFRTFANAVSEKILSRKGLTDEQIDQEIADEYSGCLFLLDEAHNIRNDDTHKASELDQVYNVLWRVFHKVKRSKVVVSTATPMINNVNEIARIANLILPEDNQMPLDWDYSKVTLKQMEPFFRGRVTFVRNLETGAVPVYPKSTVSDHVHHVSVPKPDWIAPDKPEIKEVKVPTTPGRKGKPQLRRVMIQPQPPMVDKPVESKVKLYPTRMVPGGIQLEVYSRLEGNPTLEEAEIAEEKGTQFHQAKRQAACFVFPDGSVGGTFPRERESGGSNEGIARWVISDAKDKYTATPELNEVLSNPRRLAGSSCKYADILQTETKERGCSFIYTGEFVSGGGAVVLSLCFAANGFERFEENASVFTEQEMGGEEGACISSTGTRRVRPEFKKKLRYALLTGETSDSRFASMMELFNSEENANGEYIQVMIGSIVARDGINLYNVVRGHLVTAGWHPSGIHQALSRFLRATSHEFLLKLKREEYKQRGLDPGLATIEVKIFKHIAVDAQNGSIDAALYILLAEWKDLHIRRMMRILKQCAVDCQINRRRNIRVAPPLPILEEKGEVKALPSPVKEGPSPQASYDIDFSPACDYDLCDYPCWSKAPLPTKEELDYSTYDILYADDAIQACSDDLVELLQDRGSVSFEDIKELLVETGDYREKIVYMAIDKMLMEKKQLLDRFGYICYVQTDGLNVFTQREFPTSEVAAAGSELASYSDQIIGVDVAPFNQVLDERQAGSQANIIIQMADIKDPTRGEGRITFNQILKQVSLDTKVKLLESAIAERVAGRITTINTAITERFESFSYEAYEPWEDIQKVAMKLSAKGQGQGRKAKSIPKLEANFEFEGEPLEGSLMPSGKSVEKVYIHTLYSAKTKLTSYSVTSDFTNVAHGRIRLYKPSEGLGWRDADPYGELQAYGNIVQADLHQRMARFEREPVYGSIYQDGKFRIHIKTDVTDKRRAHRGAACKTMRKSKLINIMYQEGLPREGEEKPRYEIIPPPDVKKALPNTREKLINFLLEKPQEYANDRAYLEQFDDFILKYIAQWYASGVSRDYMCEEIKRRFKETDRLLIV